MAGKVLSISLGSEIVKVCEAALAGKRKVHVYNAIDLLVPEGLCEDGVIMDVEALANAIKQGLAGEGFTAKRVVFTITSKRIANKEAIIPFCKENRIRDIVQVNASEYFPISNLENYTINHSILETVQNEGVKNYRLSVTATPNELIEQYYALAKAMGMSVEAIDYSGNSILQLLKLQTAGEGVDAILQIGGEHTVVNIMDGSTLVMQRTVPYGRLALADAVKAARDISDDEADMVLLDEDLSVLLSEYPDVADSVRMLLSSVGRILEFYRARNAEHPIERIYIIGDVTSVNGLAELIDSEFEQDVAVIESLRGVEIKNHNVLSDEIVANYLANIGAVIAPMRIYVSAEGKKGEKVSGEKMPWWILIFAGVIAFAMCGGILFVYFTNKSENDSIRAQIAAIEDVEALRLKYEQSQADLSAMQKWYDTTKGANESLARFVADLETVMPKEIAITKFTSNSGEVNIEGTSYGKPPIAEFVIQLKKLPYISDVRMDVITESIEDLSAKDSFTINFVLQYDDPDKESASEDTEEGSNDEESASGSDEAQNIEFVDEEPPGELVEDNNESSEAESADSAPAEGGVE